MTEQPQNGGATADEYDYDMAHEATTAPQPERPVPAPQLPPDMHAAGDGGDYGHDLAHNMG
jgi:hypothetical protein